MKLYSVEIIRELEEVINTLVIADNGDQALEKAYADYEINNDEVYKYYIHEVSEIDGYKILLKKVEDYGFTK